MSMKRILVVDDESLMRDFLQETLRRAGYEADVASNGEKALQRLNENSYEVILSDLKMPGMTGIELLKQVKTEHPDMRFIIMTAYGTVETAVEAMKFGAFDYILKPFSAEAS